MKMKTETDIPPKKKLIQVGLPFKKTAVVRSTPELIRKRKLETDSDNPSDVKLLKVSKCDTLKNACDSKCINHSLDVSNEPRNETINSSLTSEVALPSENDIHMIESETNLSNKSTSPSLTCTPTKQTKIKKKLTPKQMLQRQEIERKKEEQAKLKEEKLKKKLEEKEMKEKKRQAELEVKNEERKLKEEEKRQKDMEKRLKEEERKAKEEERRQREEQQKKTTEKTVKAFTSFFVPKDKSMQPKNNLENRKNGHIFMPFEVKDNMRLANISRVTLDAKRLHNLDDIINKNHIYDKNSVYFVQLKTKEYKPGHSENTWPLNLNEEDGVIIDENSPTKIKKVSTYKRAVKYRCKLLQFHDNRRPAYWGTWRKQSKTITGRTPFASDTKFFDYEIDSDDEWEEEHGESLHGSDDEKESEDDYEVDNDIFVPHGYLSDEEEQKDDISDEINQSPKSQKLKLNILGKQFEAERLEKTHKLIPRIYGCIWIDNKIKFNEGANPAENLLLSFRAVYNLKRTPFVVRKPDTPKSHTTPISTVIKAKLISVFPESLVPDLIKFIHGNKKSSQKIATEFIESVLSKDPTMNFSKKCIVKKMKEISKWIFNIACWYVNDEIRIQYNFENLSLMGSSQKLNTSVEKIKKDDVDKQSATVCIPSSNISPMTDSSKNNANVSLITNFIKSGSIAKIIESVAVTNISENNKAVEQISTSSLSTNVIPTVETMKNKSSDPLITDFILPITPSIGNNQKASNAEKPSDCNDISSISEVKELYDVIKSSNINKMSHLTANEVVRNFISQGNENRTSASRNSSSLNIIPTVRSVKNKTCVPLITNYTQPTAPNIRIVQKEKKEDKSPDCNDLSNICNIKKVDNFNESSNRENSTNKCNGSEQQRNEKQIGALRYGVPSLNVIPTVRSVKNKTCVPLIINYIPPTATNVENVQNETSAEKSSDIENIAEKSPLSFAGLLNITNIK